MSADEPDNDATLLSPRSAPMDDDVTLLASDGVRAAPVRGGSRTRRRPKGSMPPGKAPQVSVEFGHFGDEPPEYSPRPAPDPSPTTEPAPTPMSGLTQPTPDVREPHRRREAERHRRLVITIIVVALAAALLTAAVVGVIALIRTVA